MSGRRLMVREIETGEIWTCDDLAARWSVSSESVQNMCRDGRLPGAFKAGRQWRISTVALVAYERAGLEAVAS